ncbi:outer membrane protein assembly factor BamB family protein [Sphingomicrobium flavum]|uniref:outer membrane protein assembly factor BamB family protein n=1 Tax=Sphingomicrobium flavum TaxID=1229164 RepID=UPI0021AE052A|nr:PQQ-binding-like beta-propeller repeat protein [Sphingomicrobium flavum]
MKLSHIMTLALAATALSGCGIFKKDGRSTPILGERVAVLGTELEITIDPATAATPMMLPGQVANAAWDQSGGNAAKSMGHLALVTDDGLNYAWGATIGQGNSREARLGGTPVVADGRIYTMDTRATVRAFDAQSGSQIWSVGFGQGQGNQTSLYGGGVAYADGRIYATNGLGDVAAMDATNGGIIWQVKPVGPLRGAPSVLGDTLYVTSQDNQLLALDTSNGATRWNQTATLEIAGVFGASSPAVARGTVVTGFSSGELNGYRFENGRMIFSDTLARTSISRSVSSLNDIDADPVIDGNQVFAIGQGGRMVALDLRTGQRQWELNLAGIATPWVAGDWIFVVTSDGMLLSVDRNSGKVRWVNQLPAFGKPDKKRDPISYSGPVLAGNRLIVTGSNGALITINPTDGAFIQQQDIGAGVTLQPVVANNMLYLLTGEGRLLAYR